MRAGHQGFHTIFFGSLLFSCSLAAWPVELAPASASAADRELLRDDDIEAALEARFTRDELLPADFLDVEVESGVVTVAGTVHTIRERDRALAVAKALRGVRAVVDRLRVKPVSRPDTAIAADVAAALEADAAADAYEVEVHVEDGVVILSGSVEGWAERELTLQVAKDVRGVKDVRSELAILFPRQRSDREITSDVEARLQRDAWLFDDPIRVEVNRGHVVLGGMVGSAAEKARARHLAGVAGVRSIDSQQVTVDWRQRDQVERTPPSWPRTDEEVRRAVEDALRHDPRVAAADIRVSAEGGVITLAGSVDALSAKQAGEADAVNTVGVWHVKNLIKVNSTGASVPPDGEVADRIREALDRSPFFQDRDLHVAFRGGRAVLKGTVANSFEKSRAGTLAGGIDGVVSVSNQLRFVRPGRSFPGDAERELWRAVHQELWWTPSLYDEQITVDVEDGVVTLQGAVDTVRDRRLATERAYAAGAVHVRNRLRVEYAPDFFTTSIADTTKVLDS